MGHESFGGSEKFEGSRFEKKENNRFEKLGNMERESKIILHFLRHGEKESGVEGDDTLPRLTSTGRKQSVERSNLDTNVAQSVAFGSARVRSRETAQLAMVGAQDGITGDETFYELESKIKKQAGVKHAKKVLVDPRLDFVSDPKTRLGKELDDAYYGKRYLNFIVEKSDAMAKEDEKDATNSTYSTQASAVADIIKKYVNVSKRWHELVNDEDKKYEETLERFLGTHQGVPESFLAKLIDKTMGRAERDRFVKALGNQGFGFAEGFDVEIVEGSVEEEPSVRVIYNKNDSEGKEVFSFDEIVSADLIEEIINEGKRKG